LVVYISKVEAFYSVCWSFVFLEMKMVSELFKKIPTSDGIWRVTTTFTRARYSFVYWGSL